MNHHSTLRTAFLPALLCLLGSVSALAQSEDAGSLLRTSQVNSEQTDYVYWTGIVRVENRQQGAIFRYSLADASVDTVVMGIDFLPFGVAVDTLNQVIYWTDNGAELVYRIMRAGLDGASVSTVVETTQCGIGGWTDIELDMINGKMYWALDADCLGTDLMRANLDGSDYEGDLLKSPGIIEYPSYLALDPVRQEIYWDHNLPNGSRGVGRVRFDGTNLETPVSQPTRGVAIDPVSHVLYWASDSSIYRDRLDGTGREEVLTSTGDPRDLELDLAGKKIYWTERQAGKIRRANIDGSAIEDVLTGLEAPHRLALSFGGGVSVGVETNEDLPRTDRLLQNYPNPFSAVTHFTLRLPQAEQVTLKIYDLMGREIATVVSGYLPAGRHQYHWNAQGLASGAYVSRLQAGDNLETMRLVLLK